jgi:Arc/MetJ-type ribon-helix-helix transcriptional regulator
MNTESQRTTIILSKEHHEELRRLAFEKRTSMANLIREAVLELLEDEEDAREGVKALADSEGTVSWEDLKAKRAAQERQFALSD